MATVVKELPTQTIHHCTLSWRQGRHGEAHHTMLFRTATCESCSTEWEEKIWMYREEGRNDNKPHYYYRKPSEVFRCMNDNEIVKEVDVTILFQYSSPYPTGSPPNQIERVPYCPKCETKPSSPKSVTVEDGFS